MGKLISCGSCVLTCALLSSPFALLLQYNSISQADESSSMHLGYMMNTTALNGTSEIIPVPPFFAGGHKCSVSQIQSCLSPIPYGGRPVKILSQDKCVHGRNGAQHDMSFEQCQAYAWKNCIHQKHTSGVFMYESNLTTSLCSCCPHRLYDFVPSQDGNVFSMVAYTPSCPSHFQMQKAYPGAYRFSIAVFIMILIQMLVFLYHDMSLFQSKNRSGSCKKPSKLCMKFIYLFSIIFCTVFTVYVLYICFSVPIWPSSEDASLDFKQKMTGSEDCTCDCVYGGTENKRFVFIWLFLALIGLFKLRDMSKSVKTSIVAFDGLWLVFNRIPIGVATSDWGSLRSNVHMIAVNENQTPLPNHDVTEINVEVKNKNSPWVVYVYHYSRIATYIACAETFWIILNYKYYLYARNDTRHDFYCTIIVGQFVLINIFILMSQFRRFGRNIFCARWSLMYRPAGGPWANLCILCGEIAVYFYLKDDFNNLTYVDWNNIELYYQTSQYMAVYFYWNLFHIFEGLLCLTTFWKILNHFLRQCGWERMNPISEHPKFYTCSTMEFISIDFFNDVYKGLKYIMWGFLIGGSLAPFLVWIEYALGDSQTDGAKVACIFLNFCTHPIVTIGLIYIYLGCTSKKKIPDRSRPDRAESRFDVPMSFGGQPDERDLTQSALLRAGYINKSHIQF